jgi:hypothetical protein
MIQIKLTNNFHNTSTILHSKNINEPLSLGQKNRSAKLLCGNENCVCGHSAFKETDVLVDGKLRVRLIQTSQTEWRLEKDGS